MFCIVLLTLLYLYRQSKQNKPIKTKKMKKRILLLSIALVSFTAFSFAAATPTTTNVAPASVSKNVINSFNREFANASNIQWEVKANFVKAQFNVNDMVLFAYFNNSGELI